VGQTRSEQWKIMSTRRQERVSEQIKIELGKVLEEQINDPRLNLISITEVTISSDLREANIYASALAGQSVEADVLAGLEHAKGFLRRELARRMQLRVVPNLHFHWDNSLETGDRISRLLDQIDKED
jgi:ribosome-binding factor A